MAEKSDLQKDLDELTASLGGTASAESLFTQTDKVFGSLFKHKVPVIEYPKGQYDPNSQMYVGADSGQPVLVAAGAVPIPGPFPGGAHPPRPPHREPTMKTTVYYVQESTARSLWRTTANGTDHSDDWDTHIDWLKETKADED